MGFMTGSWGKFPLFVFILVWIFTGLVHAENEPAVKITGDEIFKNLYPKHPRLMARQEDFQKIKEAVQQDDRFKKWWQKVQANADKLLKEPPVKYELPDGVRLLEISRRALNRTQLLALAYQITGDAKYKDRLWVEMDAVTKFQDWHPVHYLDTAEMTHAVAIAYDWLYEAWTPEQRLQLRTAIVEKGLKQSLPLYHKNEWWVKAEHNWNQVCNGGMGMGALAVAEDEPALAKEILQAAVASIPLAMRHYAPDGAWGEGPGYWNYATSYTVYFLSSLETATGSDYGLSVIPGFSLAGDFPLYMNGPSGHSFNFADAGDNPAHGSAMFWLSRKFSTPEYAVFEQAYAEKSPGPMDLLWGIPCLTAQNQAAPRMPSLNKYFREVEVAALRSDATDVRAFYVGFKSGSNKVNHSHLDCGSFILDVFGKRWGMDLGSDDYNLPGYFGKLRWTYYRLRAEGHNTLVFNPDLQPDQDPNASTRITRFSDQPDNAFAIADLTSAYARNAKNVQRGIALRNKKSVIVQDEIEALKPNDLWWFFHTQAEIKLDDTKKIALLTFGEDHLQARILSPADATFDVMDTVPLPTSPHPEKQLAHPPKQKIQKLAIHLPQAQNVRITVEFSAPESAPSEVTPLSEWGSATPTTAKDTKPK